MIKVLHYTPSYNYGGIETYTLETSKYLKEKCQFTYVVEVDVPQNKIKEIENNNGKVIRIPNLTKENMLKNFISIFKIIKNNNFDVIHIHDCDIRFFPMMLGKFFKIKKRIYHIHSINIEGGNITKRIKKLGIKLNLLFSNQILSCSNEAARNKTKNNNYIIVKNGVNLNKFKFNLDDRKEIRSILNIDDKCKVILCVGRLCAVKNFVFMIKLMKHLIKKEKNYKLLIVGDGEEKDYLTHQVKKNNLEKNVIFLGSKNDVTKFYSAADIFCLPSKREGLGIVLIEAQVNGLPCIASENVPKEVNVSNKVIFLNTNDEKKWINTIIKNNQRYNKQNDIKNAGYDIADSSQILYKVYTNN